MKAKVLVLLAALTGGCSSPTPKASQETITLIDAGQVPHRSVAYRPTRAHPMKAVSESMHFAVDWTLQSARDGQSKYRFEITDFGFVTRQHREPRPGETEEERVAREARLARMAVEEKAAVDEVAALVRKMGKGTVVADERGRVGATHDSALAQVSPSVPILAEQIVVPLPAEPIGVGARWRIRGASWGDATVELEYQAKELSAEGVTVTFKGRGVQGGVTTELEGEIATRFDDLLPQRGQLRLQSQLPGFDAPLTMTLELK